MKQFEARNMTMMMDLYELTMSNAYFLDKIHEERVIFDVFYRKNPDGGGFAIFAGLEQIIEYIENLHFSKGDIEYLRSLQMFDEDFLEYLMNYQFKGNVYAFREGTIMYPNEPMITVEASLIDAQLIETAILNQINHQSLIATKARRVVRAAGERIVADFGARRAHNVDAAIYGARAAYIGGVDLTATVIAGQEFGIPVTGTMAHSWIMYYQDEYTAFAKYAEIYPENCSFLIDTYDVIHSGIVNAVKVAKEILIPRGHRLKGVRLDSGDLAYLSKKVRKILDEAGLDDCKIIASNSLDEYTIRSILNQGGCIDIFGVGERLITAKTDPVFGAVYKIAAVNKEGEWSPRIKISETFEKITNPGRKKVYRVYDQLGKGVADLITKSDEIVEDNQPYEYKDPLNPWKKRTFENCEFRELQIPIIENGIRLMVKEDLKDIRNYVKEQLEKEIWQEEQRFENPHRHYMDMSLAYFEMKNELLNKNGES